MNARILLLVVGLSHRSAEAQRYADDRSGSLGCAFHSAAHGVVSRPQWNSALSAVRVRMTVICRRT
jgi:hypothetical protein